jgi:hypothetical protein
MRRHGKGTELRDQINKSKIRLLVYRLVSSASEMLATGIEMKLVRFDSIDEAAIEYYRALGFQLDSSGRLVISVGDS